MNVSTAVAKRRSIREFTDQPVADELLRSLLAQAARSPSGGNLQPWRIYVINGGAMNRFLAYSGERTKGGERETPAYAVYPPGLKEPYRSARFKVGEDMYAKLGIPREDKPARLRRLAENYRFFGAPAAFFCFIDRDMGPPQWSDLGMFLQTFMLLATAQGLGTCAQEAWAARPETVTGFVGAPPELMLFCGMAVGYTDTSAAVNSLVSERAPLDDWVSFLS